MDIISLDYETYYDSEFTLKKLTTESYVRDPRFEVHCVGVYRNGREEYYGHSDVEPFLRSIDWRDTACLCHNAHFDGLILSHVYGIRPAQWLDTLSMSRAVHGLNERHSLEALAKRYGLPAKTVPYKDFIGLRWHEMPAVVQQALMEGAAHDAQITYYLFFILNNGFPQSEHEVIDGTVRMFTEGRLSGDTSHFRSIAENERNRKDDILRRLQVPETVLASTEQFVGLLEELGVEVPLKDGPVRKNGTCARIPCVAKTDMFMKDMRDNDEGFVGDLCRARMDIKSNIAERRAERLGSMSERGPLCVHLNYYGAHTGRWSGGDKLNFQNLPNVEGGLRAGISAPDGHVLIVVDLAQIECRMLNVSAGQWDIVKAFEEERDLYCELASHIYGRPITTNDKIERKVGKHDELGCGYGQGWRTFKRTVYVLADGLVIDDELAQRSVQAYRDTHQNVLDFWSQGDRVLSLLHRGSGPFDPSTWGVCGIEAGKLILPNGLPLHYELKESRDEKGRTCWFTKTRQGWRKIWGGHLVENYVQAIARVAFTECWLAACAASQHRLVCQLMAHDEAVFLCPAGLADDMVRVVRKAFSTPPKWMPRLPMKCEIKVCERYEKP